MIRVHLLSKHLDELAVARHIIILQLETLDARAGAAQLERNILRNTAAQISILPDDVLTMIFEEGIHPQKSRSKIASFDYGVLVSHGTTLAQCLNSNT